MSGTQTSNPFMDPSKVQASISNPSFQAASPAMNMSLPTGQPPIGSLSTVPFPPPPGAYATDKTTPVPNGLMDDIGNSINATQSSTILKIMRMLNIFLASFTIMAGVLSFVYGKATEFDAIVASLYIILFGLLLLAFELRNESMDKTIQLNFGFMYGYKTRTIFLIFMAIWPLSINLWITYLDAGFLFCNAFFNLYVIYSHPAFSSTPPAYASGTAAIPDVSV